MTGEFGLEPQHHKLIENITKYRKRGEPLPFGTSEKIWELNDYETNFREFQNEFVRIKTKYEEDERRLA